MFEEFPDVSEGSSCSAGAGVDLSIPTWYRYLNCDADGNPQFDNINDVWGIAAGILDIVLWLAGLLAVFFMIYGGVKFVISQGQPEKITQARNVLMYAASGLVLAVIARTAVQFVFNQFV